MKKIKTLLSEGSSIGFWIAAVKTASLLPVDFCQYGNMIRRILSVRVNGIVDDRIIGCADAASGHNVVEGPLRAGGSVPVRERSADVVREVRGFQRKREPAVGVSFYFYGFHR